MNKHGLLSWKWIHLWVVRIRVVYESELDNFRNILSPCQMTFNWIKMFNNRIKAKAKLYFDVDGESVTASEESLSDAMAKVKCIFPKQLFDPYWLLILLTGDPPARNWNLKRGTCKKGKLGDVWDQTYCNTACVGISSWFRYLIFILSVLNFLNDAIKSLDLFM